MPSRNCTIATTAAVNDDVAEAKWSRKPYGRRITTIGIGGSAQPGDCQVHLEIEGVDMGEFKNMKGGANTYPDAETSQRTNIPVPPNYLVEILIDIVPTTNDGLLMIEFVP